MSYQPDFYVANGVQTQFDLTFDYLARDHVFVAVNGINVTFSWVDANTVQPTSTPSAGARVVIYRVTPNLSLVDFEGGDIFPEGDLNTAFRQALFLAQEAEHHSRRRTLRLSSTDSPNELDELPPLSLIHI